MDRRFSVLLGFCGCLGPYQSPHTSPSGALCTPAPRPPIADTSAPLPSGDTGADIPPISRLVDYAIVEDTDWDASAPWILAEGVHVHVTAGATLSIEAGAQIRGRPGSALVVEPDGHLAAHGTADAPIVFNSDQAIGARRAGDWGGLALLGDAPTRFDEKPPLLVDGDPDTAYGGQDLAHDCGSLEYVRIAFAGAPLSPDLHAAGLTVAGCGYGTLLEHIQIHRSGGDGLSLRGGSASLRYIAVTGVGSDTLDWTEGWSGCGQFFVLQHLPALAGAPLPNGGHGIRADAQPTPIDLVGAGLPEGPALANLTALGAGPGSHQSGLLLEGGAVGRLSHLLVGRQGGYGIDLSGNDTIVAATKGLQGSSASLSLEYTVFFEVGADGQQWNPWPPPPGEIPLDEIEWIDAQAGNVRSLVPPLPAPEGDWATHPDDAWVPPLDPLVTDAPPPFYDDPFFTPTRFLGAADPDASTPWWAGWTDFPTE